MNSTSASPRSRSSKKHAITYIYIYIFHSNPTTQNEIGIFGCHGPRCKICIDYLMECKEFTVSNGTVWRVPSRITCNSLMVVYYQVCLGCNTFSNVGKTNNFRLRTNDHICKSKSGLTTDKFDQHVFTCKKDHETPTFKLYTLLEVNDYDKLREYEDYFHKQGFDTLNRRKATAKV